MVTAEIIVKENKVWILRVANVNYISLIDLAKYPYKVIRSELGIVNYRF